MDSAANFSPFIHIKNLYFKTANRAYISTIAA